jgi:hypothetical protein
MVDHLAHVGAVNAHAESVGGGDDVQLARDEIVLDARPFFSGQSGVIELGGDTDNLARELGGGNVDYFLFSNGAVLTGSIDGQGGRDTFDEYAYATGRNFAATATGATDGFNLTEPTSILGTAFNIDELVGSAAFVDSLTGLDQVSQWTMNALPLFSQYLSANTLYFVYIDTLIGGSAADTFSFADTVTLAGYVDGRRDPKGFLREPSLWQARESCKPERESGKETFRVWKITIAPGETIGLIKEVDEAIESAGGWPVK